MPAKKAAAAVGLASQVTKKAAGRAPGGPRLLFDRLFGVDPSVANEDVMGTIPQALFLMNSPLINNRMQARPGTVLGEILTTAPNERVGPGTLFISGCCPASPRDRKSRSAASISRTSATSAKGLKTSTGA